MAKKTVAAKKTQPTQTAAHRMADRFDSLIARATGDLAKPAGESNIKRLGATGVVAASSIALWEALA